MQIWKVVHRKGDVETVYVTRAATERDAIWQVRDTLRPEEQQDGTCSAVLWDLDIYKLYTINLKTGEVT